MKIQNIEFEDFSELYIHKVPMGCILNAETAKLYPLIPCDTYIWSKNQDYMLQTVDDVNYELINISNEGNSWFNVRGTLSEVKEEWIKHLTKLNNEKTKINSNNKM